MSHPGSRHDVVARRVTGPASLEFGDHAIHPVGLLALVGVDLADPRGGALVEFAGRGVDQTDCLVLVADVAVPLGGLPGVPAVEGSAAAARDDRSSFRRSRPDAKITHRAVESGRRVDNIGGGRVRAP